MKAGRLLAGTRVRRGAPHREALVIVRRGRSTRADVGHRPGSASAVPARRAGSGGPTRDRLLRVPPPADTPAIISGDTGPNDLSPQGSWINERCGDAADVVHRWQWARHS